MSEEKRGPRKRRTKNNKSGSAVGSAVGWCFIDPNDEDEPNVMFKMELPLSKSDIGRAFDPPIGMGRSVNLLNENGNSVSVHELGSGRTYTLDWRGSEPHTPVPASQNYAAGGGKVQYAQGDIIQKQVVIIQRNTRKSKARPTASVPPIAKKNKPKKQTQRACMWLSLDRHRSLILLVMMSSIQALKKMQRR